MGISAAILAACLDKLDVAAVRHVLDHASMEWVALSFGSFLLIPLLGGIRWAVALRAMGEEARPGFLTILFSVGMSAGQALPSLAGDGVRAWLAMQGCYRLRAAVHSVVLERVAMLLALLALGAATGPLLADRLGSSAPGWMAALLLAAGCVGLVLLAKVPDVLPTLHGTLANRLKDISVDTGRVVFSRWMPVIACAAIGSNLNFVLAYALLGRALHVPASPTDFLAFVPLVTLATTLPISLGGWGVREGTVITLLHSVAIPMGDAMTLSVMAGLLNLAASLPGSLVWWLQHRNDPGAGRFALGHRRPSEELPSSQVGAA